MSLLQNKQTLLTELQHICQRITKLSSEESETINSDRQKSKFAFVSVVMKGDSYVAGALVLARSLLNTKTVHDLVCIVTPDVSDQAVEDLSLLYTHVIRMEYINFPAVALHTQKQREKYESWMDSSMTLYTCLWLFQYEKVLHLDCDACVIQNIDHIFRLSTPAASFYNPWQTGTKNDPYPRNIRHGQKIPSQCIKRAFTMDGSFVVGGNFVLLSTGQQIVDEFMKCLRSFVDTNGRLGFHKINSGVDAQMITYFFTYHMQQEWTYIDPGYDCIPWKRNRSTPYTYLFHYFNIKPWVTDLHQYDDLVPWWSSAYKVCSDNPNLGKYFFNGTTNTQDKLMHDDGAWIQKTCCWCTGRHQFWDFKNYKVLCPFFRKASN